MVVYGTARGFAQAGHEVFVITCAPFEGVKSLAGKWETMHLMATDRRLDGHEITDPVIGGYPVQHPVAIRVFRFTPLNLFTIFNIGKYPALLRVLWHVIDMFNPHTYLVVKRILEKEKPDLIITRNLKGLGYTIPMAIRRYTLPRYQSEARYGAQHATRYTPKWFHGLHDLGALHPRGFMEWGKEDAIRAPMILIKLYREITKRLFGSPDAIVAPSQFVLDEYDRAEFFSKSKKVVVSNPVVDVPSPVLSDILSRGERNHNLIPSPKAGVGKPAQFPSPRGRGEGEGARFLYIGQLEPYKGIRVLIRAWKEFIMDHSDARLEIAGNGSMEEEVRRASGHVRGIQYHGFVPHDELYFLMQGARATILPTLAYETFGLSIIDSFAAGVPVIVSRIGATPEIVEDGVNGYLVAPADAHALATAMASMMQNALWNTMRVNAKKSAERYALGTYYVELYQMYTGLTVRSG